MSNNSFPHSPFWVQVWGLSFENLSEEVGRDLENSLSRYIETDKRSWLSEQAKFMSIRVDLPLNKPLRRGGNIVNLDGSKTWVTFKYERLPCFCFQCGLLGHDKQHCASFPYSPESPKQYGVWLKAGGNSKEGLERFRASSSRGQDDDRMGKSSYRSGEKSTSVVASSTKFESDQRVNLKFQTSRQDRQDVAFEKWGNIEASCSKAEKNPERSNEMGFTDTVAQLSNLPRDQHRGNDSRMGFNECYSLVGLLSSSVFEAQEVTSPLKANLENANPPIKLDTSISPKKEHNPEKRVIGKEMFVKKGKQAQTTPTRAQVKLLGSKWPSWL